MEETHARKRRKRNSVGAKVIGLFIFFRAGDSAESQNSIFSMEGDRSAFRDEISSQRRNASAQIYDCSIFKFLCHSESDCLSIQFLFHRAPPPDTTMRCTNIPGVTTVSGSNSPAFTISSTS